MLIGLSVLGLLLKWVLPAVLLTILVVFAVRTSILRNLPDSLGVQPIDDSLIGPPQRELAEALRKAGGEVTYLQLDAPYGHDTFLIEKEAVGDAIRVHIEA